MISRHPSTTCATQSTTPRWLRDKTPGKYLRGTEIFFTKGENDFVVQLIMI